MNKTALLKRYTRIGLCLPLLLPLVLMGVAALGHSSDTPWLQQLPDGLLLIGAVLIGSLYIGGIPYLIYYLFAWQFSKRRTFKQLYLFLLLSPMAFYSLQFIGLVLYDAYQSISHQQVYSLTNKFADYASISAFVFPIAYSYVALILIAYHIRVRTIRPSPQSVGGQHG